jgi:hypothetical protein
VKVRRSELFKIREVLEAMPKGDRFKFSYAVAKNLRKVKTEIEDMEKAREPEQEIIEYERKRIALCQQYAKQLNGAPMVVSNSFVIDEEKQADFNHEMKELQDRYKDAIERGSRKMLDYQVNLRESVDVEFHRVKLEDVPSDILPKDLEVILDWVIEGEEK